MPDIVVRAPRNSNCEAPVAAMIRALPVFFIASRRELAACSAAAWPREALSSNTLMTIGEPQHFRQCSTHDHLPRVRRNITRFEQRVVLLHDWLDPIQTVVRTKHNFDKCARVVVRFLCFPFRALPF